MKFKKLTEYLNYLIDDIKTPGVDCIVYKNHELIYRYFAGKSDISANKAMTGNEIYVIFSMTKMLTCTAALKLYEQGKYKLNDPVAKYLPEFEKMTISNTAIDHKVDQKIASGDFSNVYNKADRVEMARNSIKIIDLFTMTAGLDYNIDTYSIKTALKNGKSSTRQLVNAISESPLGFEPGTRFRYSLCHDVLGALIEVWSGERLSTYMKKAIFEPLEMTSTFFGLPKEKEHICRAAPIYTFDKNKNPVLSPYVNMFNLSDEYESGGAGLCSSTEDYAIFLDALACGGTGKNGYSILLPETVKLMGTDYLDGQTSVDFGKLRPGYGYGLGVRVHKNRKESNSLSPLGEFGWDGAAGAFSMVDTENKISLTYFQQVHGWDVKLQSEIRNAFYSEYIKI